MKKLIIFGLAGLFTLLCAFTILTQAREKMKVVCWDPHRYDNLDSTYWRNFAQIDSCFMNMLRLATFKADEDLDSAKHYQFKLSESLFPQTSVQVGQQSFYEADSHYYNLDLTPPDFDEYFSHSNVVGKEKFDFDALNNYAWYAEPDSDEAGYVMRDLKADYYNEQWIPHQYYGETITFYADFLIKISDTTYQADPFLILKAIRIDNTDPPTLDTVILASLEVRPQDLDSPNQYDVFDLTFTRADVDSGYLDYTIWWDGSRAVWLDRMEVRDAFADSLFRGLYDAKIDSVNELRADDSLYAWYLVDEPRDDQFASSAYLIAYLDSNQYPHGVQAYPCLDKMDEYLSAVNPEELWYDMYPIRPTTDSATTGGNLQIQLDSLTDGLYQTKQKAIFHEKPFLYIAQAFYDTRVPWWRYPTGFEQKVLAWLGLAYGANGIAYFTYATRDGIKGLADPDTTTGYCEPHEPNWSAVQSVNSIIDSIGWIFADTSSWKGAGGGDTATSITGSFIDSLKSAEFDSPWIEVGFFEDSAQTDYFLLVNRRCLSTEEQNVTVYIDSAKIIGDKKMWYVIDQYSQDTTFTGAINGKIPFTTHLNPGQGKLFKLAAFPDSAFHGTAHPFIWQGGIMVDGDVTVHSGKTLVIQPPAKITFYANTDVMHTWETTQCDFIVKGGLRAVGTETDSIIFTSTETNPDDWEGIYADSTFAGPEILFYCVVEYAYCGIRLLDKFFWNPDTVSNSRFSHNLFCGIYSENYQARIIHNSIFQDPDGIAPHGICLKNINTGTTPSATNNQIKDCYCGINVESCFTKISDNTISTQYPDAYGVKCPYSEKLIVDHTSVFGDSILWGFHTIYSTIEIVNSYIKGNAGHPAQYGALFFWGSGSSMRSTVIRDFRYRGVTCINELPDLGTVGSPGNNEIYSSVSSALYVRNSSKRVPGSVMAQYNWWGEYPPDSNRFYGPVVYMPALTSELLIPDETPYKVAYDGNVPEEFQLLQNYPNPFNPITTIQFTVGSIQSPIHTTLKIYNILGQLIRTLVDEEKPEGSYTVYWDGRNKNGEKVSSGIYFYRLKAGEFGEVKKMVFLR